jgi:hypothetical protein
LYAGAVLLLITGHIGVSVLCNFSWALRVGGNYTGGQRQNYSDSNEYSEKVHSFLNAKNFNILTKDLIEKFHYLIHKTVQESNLIIDKKTDKTLNSKEGEYKTTSGYQEHSTLCTICR